MSSVFALDWAATAVSLFNTILLFWLGSTVLLNADRRTWGIWLAGAGLLLGGTFFLSHSAILGLELPNLSRGLRFWWYMGLIPVVLLPLGWYVMMLWYAGYWDGRRSELRRRQQRWARILPIVSIGGLFMVGIYANPLPATISLLPVKLALQNGGGTPLLAGGYAVYLVLCIALSLDALIHPGPSSRVMGSQARERARFWLVAATVQLLLVSLVVIVALLWLLLSVRQGGVYVVTDRVLVSLARFDLFVSVLIGAVVVMLGQAVVAYEIFTGKTLPRRGLRRQWGGVLILAAGYGLLVGWTLTIHLRPAYIVLLTVLLLTIFFALLSWRSYAERERFIEQLRPFVSSQRLYDYLVPGQRPDSSAETAIVAQFQALCRDVLGARLAYLVALGPLAPLAGPPLAFPRENTFPRARLRDLSAEFRESPSFIEELNPAEYHGATWAVPLWSDRGLIGVLLLGNKLDGGFYTQEEIEIARASSERLIDTQATAEMARRLFSLQRQQLIQSKIVDRRTRQVVHDDVLPLIHTALLSLTGEERGGHRDGEEVVSLLTSVHQQLASLLREFPAPIWPAVAQHGVIEALRQEMSGELGQAFDAVKWDVGQEAEQIARQLPAVTGEVLFYAAREAIRNAARHGRGPNHERRLDLCLAARTGGTANGEAAFELWIEDDGIGLASSPDNENGEESGQGLALHSTMMAVVGGDLIVESSPGGHTRVRLSLPPDSLQALEG